MKLETKMTKEWWELLFRSYAKWIFRRIQPDNLEFYHDNIDNWIITADKLSCFEEWLFIKYYDVNKIPTEKAWKKECVKYIKMAKESHNKEMAEFFFSMYEDYPCANLDESRFIKTATPEEVALANQVFGTYTYTHEDDELTSTHTFDNAEVLDYLGVRMPIDNEWHSAWYKDENGKIMYFDLIWDWYYPIDQYFLLDK